MAQREAHLRFPQTRIGETQEGQRAAGMAGPFLKVVKVTFNGIGEQILACPMDEAQEVVSCDLLVDTDSTEADRFLQIGIDSVEDPAIYILGWGSAVPKESLGYLQVGPCNPGASPLAGAALIADAADMCYPYPLCGGMRVHLNCIGGVVGDVITGWLVLRYVKLGGF